MAKQYKYQLEESQIPTRWYNIVADLQNPPAPPLHPGTGERVSALGPRSGGRAELRSPFDGG